MMTETITKETVSSTSSGAFGDGPGAQERVQNERAAAQLGAAQPYNEHAHELSTVWHSQEWHGVAQPRMPMERPMVAPFP